MIVLDVETTGINPDKNSILSIAALDISNPEERFYEECRIWDGAEVSPLALEINGFTQEEISDADKKAEADIVKNFIYWLSQREDMTVVGQNPSFDTHFIRAASERAGERSPLHFRSLDLHTLAVAHMMRRGIEMPLKDRSSNLGSDSVMTYVGIPPEPKPHISANSILWEYEVFMRLVHDKNGLPEFEKYPIPWLEGK